MESGFFFKNISAKISENATGSAGSDPGRYPKGKSQPFGIQKQDNKNAIDLKFIAKFHIFGEFPKNDF